MNEFEYAGKKYRELAQESQEVLAEAGILTFRYYPKEKIIIPSDKLSSIAGGSKVIENAPYSIAEKVSCQEDQAKYYELFRKIDAGEKKVVENIRTPRGTFYRNTMVQMEVDQDGKPELIGGLIEFFDEHMQAAEIGRVLSSDYRTVYVVDFDRDEFVAYRVSDIVQKRYKERIEAGKNFQELISDMLKRYVVPEQYHDMMRVLSPNNIKYKLREKNTYKHDFRVLIGGTPYYFRMKAANMLSKDNLSKVIIAFSDVSKEKEAEWARLAYIDSVTGGYNYTYYSEHMKKETRKGYIISLDIRSFKVVNSVCGLEKGDFVLRSVSQTIASLVGARGHYGHLSADHFVIYMATEVENDIVELIKAITKEVHQMVSRFDIPKISPYFGATKWNPGTRIQVAYSEANIAKHNIKYKKNTNFCFFSREDMDRAVREKEIETAFDAALEERQFEIWYQPKYSPYTNELTGAEALIRWKKPTGELVSPDEFIPVYEKNGMIRELDEYVFKTVCFQQQFWERKFGKTVPISINMSRASLYYDTIVAEYKLIALETGVDLNMVPIEITESATIENEHITAITDKFYDAGFQIHMDDFGTGYTSLAILNRMKFHTLKIDKSLVDYIGDERGNRLLKYSVALARELKLKVVAEGVENEEQVEYLKQLGVDEIQGFYYQRPIPPMEFEKEILKMHK